MPLKHKGSDSSAEPKKRKRVGFAEIDPGVEPEECIKIFLVKNKDEVGATDSLCIKPIDLNQFFNVDEKIYGYKNLKVNVWLNLVSFHAYAEVTFENKSDRGKGITDLNPALRDIFGESLIAKEQFLQSFSTNRDYISSVIADGAGVTCNSLLNDADGSVIEVVQMKLHSPAVGLLYSRLFPLVLMLVDGGSAIKVTDPNWDIFLAVKKVQDPSGISIVTNVLGFATVYRFFHYPDSIRFRIGQILVLPQYQGQGYGQLLFDSVYSVALSENVYDVTVEDPSEYLQYLRTRIDTNRLLGFDPVKPAIDSVLLRLKEENLSKLSSKPSFIPPANLITLARQKLKINKKMFLACWEVLIYLSLDSGSKCMENFRACFSDHVKGIMVDKESTGGRKELIQVPNQYDPAFSFVVTWSPNSGELNNMNGDTNDQSAQEEQLTHLVAMRMEAIVKIATKILSLQKPR
ncbi:probable histone acetyltransferase type B catalytic subunit [Zingiber officinale]|uniref:probable histone acetyltransferase type B catalytic subunit n=1 Tax=Zingiber officinale TaxID=94328 RepID=UPI001C4B0852|nr:probable histone acetyltransferase type B catalytic subunit [Zingiber officinale]